MVLLKNSFLILALFGFYASAQRIYTCDFERGICSFLSNDRSNKENWMIGKGKVNSIDTGPSMDHTLGNANGSYVFVNVSAAKTNEVKLQTVVLYENYCVRFFYHMYGADIGDLTVKVQSVYNLNDYTNYFFRSKTQGDRWKEAAFYVTMSSFMKYKGYRVIFAVNHKTASNILGDIALDDIEMRPSPCPDNTNQVEKLCSFDYSNCGYTAENQTQNLNWEWQAEGRKTSSFKPKLKDDHTLGTDKGGFWFVASSNTSGMEKVSLSSPNYKPPKNSTGCLHFYYYIEADNKDFWSFMRTGTKQAYIQAYVSSANSWTLLASRAMNVTVHRQWTYVEAKLNISEDYQFEFVAGMETKIDAVIAIDDVKLFPGNCPEAGFCDFEENKCGWTDGEGDFNWLRKGAKSTVNRVIGPSTDNSLKTADGHYVVINTEGKSPGSEANLESEWFPPYDDTTCLSFYYYLNGNDVGTLKVVRKDVNITESTMWALKNDPLNSWRKAMAPLRPSSVHTQVVFRGIIGNAKKGFMALDDVKIRKGEKCDITPAIADPRYEEPTTGPPVTVTEMPKPTTEPPVTVTEMPKPETTEVALSTTEESTETVIPRRYCKKGYKLCNDGQQCIPGLLFCDGVRDCEDGSDELYGCNTASLCGEGFYFCSDRAYPPCIHKDKICDGIDDCSDGSDESLCDKCIGTFCQNGGNCSVHDRKLVCRCKSTFYHNRCTKGTIPPEPEDRLRTLMLFGLIIGVAIADILLIAIMFFICCRRRTNV